MTKARLFGRNDDLTPRELDVLRCAAEGLDRMATGRKLFVADQTVAFHSTHIIQKLRATNFTHAVALAYERGLFTSSVPDAVVFGDRTYVLAGAADRNGS